MKLKDYGEAAASFWEGLRLDPNNETFKNKFQKCIKIGKKINKEKHKSYQFKAELKKIDD